MRFDGPAASDLYHRVLDDINRVQHMQPGVQIVVKV
jgi:hypothetical protein